MDYDIYSNTKPVAGTAAEIVMDGTTFTADVDTTDWKSIVFIGSLHALVDYDDVEWILKDSDNGVDFVTVDASLVIHRLPSDGTTQSKAFHCGYIGKKRYVRAALNVDGVTAAELQVDLGTAFAPTSLTSSTTTATLVKTNHGIVSGQYINVSGASPAEYNGRFRATVSDANTLTYTIEDAGDVAASGTISVVPETPWENDPGADAIASISVGADALQGDYVVSVSHISSETAAAEIAIDPSATGDGVVGVSNIVAAGANPIFGETLRAVCTAEAGNAGTFTLYRQDGTEITTITVGVPKTIQIGGADAFDLSIADGANDWDSGDLIDIRITDLGVNRYVLTDPDGGVVGYPLGGAAFTSTHLNLTVPDSTVAVSDETAEATISVDEGLAKGQIVALLGNPLSGPLFSGSIET